MSKADDKAKKAAAKAAKKAAKKGKKGKKGAAAPALDAPPPTQRLSISGDRKAAIAILTLGEDLAREIFRALPPGDVDRLMKTAESLDDVTAQEVHQVLDDLTSEFDARVTGVSGHEGRLPSVAEEALGREALQALQGKSPPTGASGELNKLAAGDTGAFARTLAREHPQSAAVVVAMLQPDVGSKVLAALPPAMRPDVTYRIATLEAVPESVLDELAEALGRDLASASDTPRTVDGTDTAVNLLKAVKPEEEEEIFEALKEIDADMAEELRARMFVFDDIGNLNPREIQLILREVDKQQLAFALRGASAATTDAMLSNMSSRAALILREEMEAMGAVNRAKVEEARKEIVAVVMQLATEQKVNLRPGDAL